MKYLYKNIIFFAVLIIAAIVLSIPTIALHTFQPDTGISTTGTDLLAEANSTETITISMNVSNSSYDYLNQTNITVPQNSTDYANYSIDWSTLVLPSGWTCTNETDGGGNVSKLICNATSGNELQELDISFSATAFNFNDSNHIWTIDTTDNNSETNTTTFTTKIGIVPTLSAPNPRNGTVMTQYFGNFSVDVTDQNLNTASGLIFFRNQTSPTWYNQSLTCSGSSPDYICSSIITLGLWDGETVEYYFAIADEYAGYGYNRTSTSPLNVTVDLSEQGLTPYIILMPSQSSPYYNQSYNAIGTGMNTTINNNSYIYTEGIDRPHYYSIPQRSTIVYFDERTIDVSVDNSLSTILAAYEAEYVTVILHPQHVTPDMVRKLNTLFSSIDDDPFVDVAWGVVTGKYPQDAQALVDRSLGTVGLNTTTYDNYYAPDSLQFTGSSVFAPFEQAYQIAATFIGTILNPAGGSSTYLGSEATGTSFGTRLANSDDSIIYFAGGGRNDKLYVYESDSDQVDNDNNKCPSTDSENESLGCWDYGTLPSLKNNLLFISTSDYFARLSGNDTSETLWDVANANASDWDYTDSLILQSMYDVGADGPVAFVGSASVSWLTSETVAKQFFLKVLEGNDIGSALTSSKNALVLNRENIADQTAKDFISAIEDSYVLYGVPQTESGKDTDYIDYTETSLVQLDANPSTGDFLSWNLTLEISPISDIQPIYADNAWQSTYGSVWYQNVTAPINGKINISFIATLAGEYLPDPTAFNLSVSSTNIEQDNFTELKVMINRTKVSVVQSSEQYMQTTTFVSAKEISNNDFIYGIKGNRSLMFAIPYSADEILLSTKKTTINMTFKTAPISIDTLSVMAENDSSDNTENNMTIVFDIVNPTSFTISDPTIKYPIPDQVLGCIVSGPNTSGTCTVSAGFAMQNISSILPGKTQYTIDYLVLGNMSDSIRVIYNDGGIYGLSKNLSIFNLGDNITLNLSLLVSSSVDSEILVEALYLNDSGNRIIWSDTTTADLGASEYAFTPIWQIDPNTTINPLGSYLIKIYVLENGTSKYLFKKTMSVNITDRLNLNITQSDLTSDTSTGYISEELFNFTITGTALKQSGKPLNDSVIGTPSVYIYLDDVLQAPVRSIIDSMGALDTIVLEYINPATGDHNISTVVFDEFNNTDEYVYSLKVTNTIDSITIDTNATDATANEEDWVRFSGIVNGNNTNVVFDADVNVYVDGTKICNITSETDGTYFCDWQVPYGDDEKNYNISVDATSPLNTTKTISNSTDLKVVWLDVTIDPTLPDIGVTSTVNISKDLTILGSVNYRDDTDSTLVEGVKITCFINDDLSRSDGWNDTDEDTVNSFGEYSCLFSNLNHTGTYYVTISAINETTDVRGYIKDDFRIIYTAPQTDSGSGSTSPSSITTPPATDTQNDTTDTIITTDTLDIRYNKTIIIQQGTTEYIEITVTNKRNETIHDLDLTLDGVTWSDWYDILNADIDELAPNASATFMVNLNVPKNTPIDDYTINARFNATETDIDETVSFIVQVSFSDTNKIEGLKQLEGTETLLYAYNERIKALFADISDQNIFQRYAGALNGTVIGAAKDKIFEAKKLIEESRSLLEAGKTAEALELKAQADSIISEAEKMISDEESKLSVVSELFKKALFTSFFFIVLIAVLGYMLVPPKVQGTYAPKGDFFNQKIKKRKTLHSFSLKKSATQNNNYNSAQDKDPTGRNKIDQLHERFKSHLKDDN